MFQTRTSHLITKNRLTIIRYALGSYTHSMLHVPSVFSLFSHFLSLTFCLSLSRSPSYHTRGVMLQK